MASEMPSYRANLTNSSTEKAKAYIQSREIPQLFEALMTGLMFKQPDDHIEYIINCLQRIKANNGTQQSQPTKSQIKWNSFITQPNEKNDLPPLRDNPNASNINKEARVINGKNK